MFSTIAIIERKLIRAARNKSDQNSSFAAFVALHQVPEVGLCSNVILIFAFFKILLRDGENPLNCSAASSALDGSKLTSQAIQEIGAHAKIIADRKADKFDLNSGLRRWFHRFVADRPCYVGRRRFHELLSSPEVSISYVGSSAGGSPARKQPYRLQPLGHARGASG